VRRHLRAEIGAAVQPDARTTRSAIGGDATSVGPETVGGIFGGDPALKRRSSDLHRILAESEIVQSLAACDTELAGDEINVGDLFGHGVLHLDPWIHLDEHVLAALIE